MTSEDHVAAAGFGEHHLRAVLTGPTQDDVDGPAAALTGPQRQALDDVGVVGPFGEADRVAVQDLDPRPGVRDAEQQVAAGLRVRSR